MMWITIQIQEFFAGFFIYCDFYSLYNMTILGGGTRSAECFLVRSVFGNSTAGREPECDQMMSRCVADIERKQPPPSNTDEFNEFCRRVRKL